MLPPQPTNLGCDRAEAESRVDKIKKHDRFDTPIFEVVDALLVDALQMTSATMR